MSFVTAGYVLEACTRACALANLTVKLEEKLEAEQQQFHQQQGESREKDVLNMKCYVLELLDNSDSLESSEDLFEVNGGDALPTRSPGTMPRNSTKSLRNLLLEPSEDEKNEVDQEKSGDHRFTDHVNVYPHPIENLNPNVHKLKDQYKAEFPELCHIFLGRRIKLFFIFTLAMDLYGLTWSYAAIFGSGCADMLPIPGVNVDYVLYISIFAAIVIPMSCLNLSDQVLVQLLFLVVRMIMVSFMVITVAVAWASGEPHFDEYARPARASGGGGVPLFHFPSLFLLLGTSVFSCSFQFAVPGITDAVADKDTVLKKVFGTTCLFVFTTVLVCSLVLSTYFGLDQMQTSSNLNWVTYHGGTGDVIVQDDGTITRTNIALWARAISGFITVFPALDSLAVFPLCTISLGEILMNAWYGGRNHPTDVVKGWKRRTAFRFLGTCPQLVGAMLVSDLSEIANYAGIFTIFSYLICPPLLLIYSGKALNEVGLPSSTHYKTLLSRDWIA
jgi:amino acid permease